MFLTLASLAIVVGPSPLRLKYLGVNQSGDAELPNLTGADTVHAD